MRPWNKDVEAVSRGGVTFQWHHCLDCLKLIRWEEDRCYSCHVGKAEDVTAEAVLAAKATGLSTRKLAALFHCRPSVIAKILLEAKYDS